ncbi:NDP-sugar synthase [Natrialbaceae archaeon AArc-T1-2]|uniref:NDP-sugar synthase n=1 Tax=Natrialbaceae archaeon AArc-T1-2 TaxID=3053904 RepID=UPI00255B1CEA|nr:NDP-sugar synthase [Natrialbaceae archaeon AArc-T1-2]WIV67499.1 NDP-sugar synthase [Natrialbaceae archaeon AArc-T1-2]
MKAIVLAGGYATRLWPITKHRPKMLLPIGDTTVIDRIVADLEADDRISEVFVSTNQRFASRFREYIADSRFEKLTLTVEETTAESQKLGVVGALAQLVEREGIDEDTVVIAGDNLLSFDVGEFVDFFQRTDTPCIAAYDVETTDRATSYGVVSLEDGRVVDFQEKPANPNSTLVSIACYGFPAATLERLETYLEGGHNPDEPGWFIEWLQDREDVFAFPFEEAWFDIGTPESYLDALAWHLDGGIHVAETATVTGSTLGDDVQIMAGAEVVDAHLERSIVFPETTVRDCEVRSSIVDRETTIAELNVQDALIGAHTRIHNGG